ncbi:MAG: hypothetical protein M3N82_02035 [Pseudomonadota bacterium]|nr:hypothetical protein [Pseudomonadota bacterium]
MPTTIAHDESSQAEQLRLNQAVAAYRPGTKLSIEISDAMTSSFESEDHVGFVYCIRHTRSSDGAVYQYIGETALKLQARLDLHFNTAFSRKSQQAGLPAGGIHHAMMTELVADSVNYRSRFTIDVVKLTIGPQARKEAEVEEVAKLTAVSEMHYNLAEGGGNRPAHLRHGQPVALAIGDQVFQFSSKTSLWDALDKAHCPALSRHRRNGITSTTKARSRWLKVEDANGSLAQMIGLESVSPVIDRRLRVAKTTGPAPEDVWQRFHPGSPQTPRGDLRDLLESRAKAAGVRDKLLASRTVRMRYSAGVRNVDEAWQLLLGTAADPNQVEIALPSSSAESRTIPAWGRFIERTYAGQKALPLKGRDIEIRLRNAIKTLATLTNDRKLHALGLIILPRSRRTDRQIFAVKPPTPRNHVAVDFTNPFTGVTEHFNSTTELCKQYDVDPVVYYTRLKAGWRQAEALYVVKRKPSARVRREHREAYGAWLAHLSESETHILRELGYL